MANLQVVCKIEMAKRTPLLFLPITNSLVSQQITEMSTFAATMDGKYYTVKTQGKLTCPRKVPSTMAGLKQYLVNLFGS